MEVRREIVERIALLLKLDAKRLYERIRDRRAEYIGIFAMKRTRDHFPQIFKTVYHEAKLQELVHCSPESIVALDNFYSKADEMKWYLYSTEDMPQTVEDKIDRFVRELGVLHETLSLYLEADLGVSKDG